MVILTTTAVTGLGLLPLAPGSDEASGEIEGSITIEIFGIAREALDSDPLHL